MARVDSPNLNLLWTGLIIEELVRNRITQAFVSPGSRSTPLVVAAARHSEMQVQVCYDERGAAYQALGFARATQSPAVLICTSGTAGANYFPAVIEAAQDHVPMLILTADRPPELLDTGANQTIHQPALYGRYVKWGYVFPCPSLQVKPTLVLTTIDQAVHQARHVPAGPVHLNCMFREPLAPQAEPVPAAYLESLSVWQGQQMPFTRYISGQETLESVQFQALSDILNQAQTGLLLVGRLASQPEKDAVAELSRVLNWPVYADILSGLRLAADLPQAIPYYDLLLSAPAFQALCRPQVVLHVGELMLSSRLNKFLAQSKLAAYILAHHHPERRDDMHHVSHRIQGDIVSFCQQLIPQLHPRIETSWVQNLRQTTAQAESVIAELLSDTASLTEPGVARLISQLTPPDSVIFAANSMPVRDLNMFGVSRQYPAWVVGNRGTSGIDGNLASAIGFARASNQVTTLLTGDLTFLHDINSLTLLKTLDTPLIIVVVNNGGGGIFSFLPIADYADVFEPYFGTPHSYQFEAIAQMFGLNYARPQTLLSLREAYQQALQNSTPSLIEVDTERQQNHAFHQEILSRLNQVLFTEN